MTNKKALNISSSGLGDLDNPELHSQSKGFKSLSAEPSKRKKRSRKQLDRYREVLVEFGSIDCGLCLRPITSLEELTVDHIKPRMLGGNSRKDNLQPAHSSCNLSKGSRRLLLPPYKLTTVTDLELKDD